MPSEYNNQQRKQLELYFRCLSSVCTDSLIVYHYIPFGFPFTDRILRRGSMKKAFAAWGVIDKESLLSRVQWLLEDGLREEYKKLHTSLASRNEVSRKRYVESSVDHPDHAKVVIVNAFLHQLPSGEIAAFGGAWAIFMCNMGLTYGYLTKDEAWGLKLKAARHLQQCYNSWEDYLTAFVAGNSYSDSDSEMKMQAHITSIASMLLGSSTLAMDKAQWGLA
ncbi:MULTISPECIES: DUF1266 domain-containing protein [Paenibacillus]|uniref:DUF1266 domain-containing protein n=1 Tax=Paenibacillus alvei TaxID=44250 RepID=A0ABT4ECV4_PAEAL|nr:MULTISPECIES: DUF1266 domain-containing protein [Paenibacillus]EPY14468.1 hypothetical protein PAAL66ix_02081 [Paenibacillus alvei A6-6i-x]MCY9531581.1 DUF1266 domain-containing protein [Paenibacillus alvei]